MLLSLKKSESVFCKNLFFCCGFLVDSTSIIVVGGINEKDDEILNVEHISDANNTCNFTDMEKIINDSPTVFTTPISENLLVCGGSNNRKNCLTLDEEGQWTYLTSKKDHEIKLNSPRRLSSAATTKHASFIFGGTMGKRTSSYEYMHSSERFWRKGKKLIPDGFKNGCTVTISDDKIWLIGGDGKGQERRVLSFDPITHNFTDTKIKLNVDRHSHRCSLMPDKSGVMVTGGTGSSTEIIDFKTGLSKPAGNMATVRSLHGIGTLVINNSPTLVVFGGYTWAIKDKNISKEFFDSFEKYDEQTKTWSIWDGVKLKTARREFGFATLKNPSSVCKDAKN